MKHRRASIRAALRLALSVAPRFAEFEIIPAWTSSVDARSLPVLGIATPSETKDQDTHQAAERAITIIVVLKRLGGEDIDDVLDDDSDHVEGMVLATLRTLGIDAQLDRTDVSADGSADRRIGTLTMTFRAFVQTPDPLTP